jgi:hypothetical protein
MAVRDVIQVVLKQRRVDTQRHRRVLVTEHPLYVFHGRARPDCQECCGMSKVVRRKSGEAGRGDRWVPHSLPPICEPDGLAVGAAEEHILWLLARSLGNQGIDQ